MAVTVVDLVREARARVSEIPVEIAKTCISTMLVLDVREPGEFAAGHVPDAVNVPRGLLEFQVDNHPLLKSRDADILVVCQGGNRAILAADTLAKMGFPHVTVLSGGYNAWCQAGGASGND